MEKFQEHLIKANSFLKTADHLVYITFPLIKENRLLRKILEDLGESTYNIFKAILEREYLYKRIELYKDDKLNFEKFRKCSLRYGLTQEEVETIYNIFNLMEKHKESPFEFVRRNRFVMMSENLKTESIDLEQLKRYLNLIKIILIKTQKIIDEKK